jgi:GDPmannose 4,6-dehydratase
MKTALICGVGGQDGGYLAALLLEKGYRVWGTSRDAHVNSFANLQQLGIRDRVTTISMAPDDFRSVLTAVTASEPDEIYALAGQSSVGLSFELPAETLQSMVFGALNLLEAIRYLGRPTRLYHAGSSECFGDTGIVRANEMTPFRPRSPYGVAKASAHMLVANYRDAYGIFACNGILFNHESPHRPNRFVTSKIVNGALRIAAGDPAKLRLGRLDIVRDWGWAPEYVDAMWRMLQHDRPDDYIVATGVSASLADFVAAAFAVVGLDWRDHVDIDPAFIRPTDLAYSAADPARARDMLGWQATVLMPEVARRMVVAGQASAS